MAAISGCGPVGPTAVGNVPFAKVSIAEIIKSIVVVFFDVLTPMSLADDTMMLSFFEFKTSRSEFNITCGLFQVDAGVIPTGSLDDNVRLIVCWSVNHKDEASLFISSMVN